MLVSVSAEKGVEGWRGELRMRELRDGEYRSVFVFVFCIEHLLVITSFSTSGDKWRGVEWIGWVCMRIRMYVYVYGWMERESEMRRNEII